MLSAIWGKALAAQCPLRIPWPKGRFNTATRIEIDRLLRSGTVTLAPDSYTINTESGTTS